VDRYGARAVALRHAGALSGPGRACASRLLIGGVICGHRLREVVSAPSGPAVCVRAKLATFRLACMSLVCVD